jgi:simple sugar transport system ATP-binding protein
MIGRQVDKLVDDSEHDPRKLSDDKIALELVNYYVNMPGEKVINMNVKIREGEIFGFGGLAGQGKIGIHNGIQGLFETRGDVLIHGEKLDLSKRGEALRKDIAFVSEDRRGVGLLLGESIERNIIFSAMQVKNEFLKHGLLDRKASLKHTREMIELLDIRTTGPQQTAGSLSGGNQQKVCLARALTLKPNILIVAEPTRGIDIGAKKLVLEYLTKLNREQGTTIIVISSELVELRSICDRIAIVAKGAIAAILDPEAPDADYGLAMSGLKREDVGA